MAEIERRLNAWWPIVAALLAFVVWLVRLEGKVGMTERELTSIQTNLSSDMKELKLSIKELSCQTQSLENKVVELRTIINRKKL